MPAENIKLIKHLLDTGRLIYGAIKNDNERARPLEVTEQGNIGVEVFNSEGDAVDPASVCDDLDGQPVTSANVTTASAEVLAANVNRKAAVLTNDSDTVMYLALGENAVANQGIRLNAAGGALTLSKWGSLFTTEAIYAIHGGAGNKVLAIQEMQ